jgi:anti-sigma B factor antagonist
VVHVAGELDIATAPALAEHLREQTITYAADLVLDLSAVTLLAGNGVSVIVRALDDDSGIHGRLHLTGVTGNRPVERVLHLTGVRPILDVYDTLPTLLSTLQSR